MRIVKADVLLDDAPTEGLHRLSLPFFSARRATGARSGPESALSMQEARLRPVSSVCRVVTNDGSQS